MNTNEPDSALVPCTAGPLAPSFPRPSMTPAQARVDAVAALTGAALARAATLELTTEETQALTADFADNDFRTGAGGKEALLYIEHAALRDRLNTVLGLGQWAIIVRETWSEDLASGKGMRVYVRAMMLVRGCYVAEAVGDMDYFTTNASQNYGDGFEGAKTAAFRRCAKEFGVGLQAWRKDWCEGWWQRKRTGARPATPVPQTQREPAPAPSKPAAAPTPRAMTPEERRETLLVKLKGIESEATAVMIEEGIILPNETFEDITPLRIEQMSPDNMLALIKTVRMRKTDNDQVPGAEVPDEPSPIPVNMFATVEEVNTKEGKTKAGKPWVKYGIKLAGVWHNTFSDTLYKLACELKGLHVRYTATQNQFGWDLNTLEAIPELTP